MTPPKRKLASAKPSDKKRRSPDSEPNADLIATPSINKRQKRSAPKQKPGQVAQKAPKKGTAGNTTVKPKGKLAATTQPKLNEITEESNHNPKSTTKEEQSATTASISGEAVTQSSPPATPARSLQPDTPVDPPTSGRPQRTRKAPERFAELKEPARPKYTPRSVRSKRIWEPNYLLTDSRSRLVRADVIVSILL